jgi:hypothetical protein
MKAVLLILILLSLNSCTAPSIEGIWINETNPNLIWEFKGSGQLIEKYGDVEKTSSSSYQILHSSQSCSSGTTDTPDEIYLKITDAELSSFCYYLESLSEKVLVLIDSDTGRMLIFNKEI